MNLALIIGNHPRNLILLKKILNIRSIKIKKLIVHKREHLNPSPPKNLDPLLKKLWKLHFLKRNLSEKKFFNVDHKILKKVKNKTFISSAKELNSKKIERLFIKNKYDLCIISGIPIINESLIKKLPKFVINLHLGLIPYYKGSITGFWPMYNLKPTMLGTTFHFIGKKVDTGEIIHQNVPRLEKSDGIHDVASKAILSAVKDIKIVIGEVNKRIKFKSNIKFDKSLEKKGKTYKSKDWKPEMLKKIYLTYNDKISKLYLEGKIKSPKPKLIKIKL